MNRAVKEKADSIARLLLPPVTPTMRAAVVGDLVGAVAPSSVGQSDLTTLISRGSPDLALPFLPVLEPQQRAYLRQAAMAVEALTMRAESSVHLVRAAFNKGGLSGVLFKGPAVRRLHPKLARRSYSDIDVLIDPIHRAHAIDSLEAAGFERVRMPWEPRPGSSFNFEHAVTLRSPTGGALDLHHVIPPQRWGRSLDVQRLRSRGSDAGDNLYFAGAVHSGLVAALSVVHGVERSLRPWRDLAVLLTESTDGFESDLTQECVDMGLAAPTYVVLRGMQDLLQRDLSLTPELERFVTRSDLIRLGVIARSLASQRGRIAQLAGMRARTAARYARHAAWPDKEYLQLHLGPSRVIRMRWLRHQMRRRSSISR